MAWRSSTSKHARPAGRGELRAAYADLQHELGEVRRHRYDDTLEIARLTSLVDALTVQASRLRGELSALRRELQESRSVPPVRDPYVEVLASEAADLRSAVAAQHLVLVELTARIGQLLEREAPAPAPVATAPATLTAPAPAAGPYPQPVEPHDAAPVDDGHEVHLTDPHPFGAETPSFADDQLDDLALLRLRLIRQTLTAEASEPVPTSATP